MAESEAGTVTVLADTEVAENDGLEKAIERNLENDDLSLVPNTLNILERRNQSVENPVASCGDDTSARQSHHVSLHADECDVRDISSTKSGNIKRHRLTPRKEKWKCDECSITFTMRSNLSRHIKRFHTVELPYKCDTCGKSFTREGNLKKHWLTHTKEELDRCRCDKCLKTFSSRSHLLRHSKLFHAVEKPYKCDTCDVSYTEEGSLKWHNRLTHAKKELGPWKCDKCPKTLSSRSGLSNHMYLHTGKKPYKCDLCGQRFALLKYKKKHRLRHRKENLFCCLKCDCKFSYRNDLLHHVKTVHTDSPPSECANSEQMLTRRSRTKDHLCQVREDPKTEKLPPTKRLKTQISSDKAAKEAKKDITKKFPSLIPVVPRLRINIGETVGKVEPPGMRKDAVETVKNEVNKYKFKPIKIEDEKMPLNLCAVGDDSENTETLMTSVGAEAVEDLTLATLPNINTRTNESVFEGGAVEGMMAIPLSSITRSRKRLREFSEEKLVDSALETHSDVILRSGTFESSSIARAHCNNSFLQYLGEVLKTFSPGTQALIKNRISDLITKAELERLASS